MEDAERRGKGQDAGTFPAILGRDLAGTVVKLGSNVRALKVGQQVISLVKGSYADYITARADDLTVLPGGLDLQDSAALPLVVTTDGQLIQHVAPKEGDVVLITGALGSVGRAATYLVNHLGAKVIAGVKKKQKDEARSLSVDQVIGRFAPQT